MTESYKETEGEEVIIRRAKAFANILDKMTVKVYEGELIVGSTTSKPRGSFLIPEIQWEWYLDEMDTMADRLWDACQPIAEWEKEKMRECLPYWKNKCTWDKVRHAWPSTVNALNGEVFMIHTSSMSGQHFGHNVLDYEWVLAKGLRGLIDEARETLAGLVPVTFEDIRKYTALRAYIIVMEAVIRFARRYSDCASTTAQREQDPRRKQELVRIAETCSKVPEYPPETFYEALQATHLLYVASRIEAYAPGVSIGRPDQYLYPYYQRDLEAGVLSHEEAVELVSLMFIKVNDLACLMSAETAEFLSGFPTLANITIGGVTPEGRDAVNDLTYVFMKAEEIVALTAEEIVVRVGTANPEEFLLRACELALKLKGKIKFNGDATGIRQLLSDGKTLEEARDFVVLGCSTPNSPGKSHDITAGSINMAYILELALNDGASRMTGRQVGLRTGDPKNFTCFEEVWEAYKQQAEYMMTQAVIARNIDRRIYAENVPIPFNSAMTPACFKSGVDLVTAGEVMCASEGHGVVGTPNVGDSLAAIKKLVFKEKRFTISQIIDALDKDFGGEEEIQHLLLAAPKFGNDDDYVDLLVKDVLDHASDFLAALPGIAGSKHSIAAMAGTGNLVMGSKVGALPDGRPAGAPLAEGGISPSQGKNVSGATATMNSVAKLDHSKISGGSTFNMRFNPEAVNTPDKLKKFASLLLTFCEKGGYHVQFNFLSADTLRAAQERPDLYRDLLVRVATYSAYFVELSKKVQDDIIAKTEFQMV
jgi:formate C-acetyltransferase